MAESELEIFGPRPQRYFLEMVRGDAAELIAAIEIPLVHAYMNEPAPSEHADWTLGSLPVEQHKGIRQRLLVVRGVSGLSKRRVTRVDSDGIPPEKTASGRQLFEDFEKFIEEYYSEAAQYRTAFVQDNKNWPRMIFRALREGDSFYVRDIRLVPSENVGSSRMSYEYALTMTGIGEAVRTVTYNIINSPSMAVAASQEQLTDILGMVALPIEPTFTSVAATAPIATDTGGEPTFSLIRTLNLLPGEFADMRAPATSFLGRISEFTGAAANVAVAFGTLPRSIVSDLYAFAVQTSSDLYTIWDALSWAQRDKGRPWLLALQGAIRACQRQLLRLLGSAGATAPTSAPTQMSQPTTDSSSASSPVSLEQVLRGEDIFAFALRVLGDPSRWTEIVLLNGMTSGDTLGDGSPFTSGIILAVPSLLSSGLTTLPGRPSQNVFGTDLAWSIPAWDFVPTGTPPRDIASITGPPNLQARLMHRFTKEQGSDLTAPNLGMPAVTGQAQTETLAALLAAQALTQATADGAVKRLRSASFQQVANTYTINLNIVPIAGRTLSYANIPVGIAAGGP